MSVVMSRWFLGPRVPSGACRGQDSAMTKLVRGPGAQRRWSFTVFVFDEGGQPTTSAKASPFWQTFSRTITEVAMRTVSSRSSADSPSRGSTPQASASRCAAETCGVMAMIGALGR